HSAISIHDLPSLLQFHDFIRTAWIALYSLALPALAQVKITRASDRISVEIDGKAVHGVLIGTEVAKPYLFRRQQGLPASPRPDLGQADLNGFNGGRRYATSSEFSRSFR